MPVPLTGLTVAEVIHHGTVAAAGSNARVFDYVWHFRRLATTISPTEIAVNNAFMTNIGSVVMAALNVRATTSYTSTRFINDWTRRAVKTTDTTAGAITGDSMVMDDCAMLHFASAYRGQTGLGSKHLYPMSESDTTTTGDIFNAACITKLTAIVTAALAGFTDATGNQWVMCIYSRKLSKPKQLPTASIITNDVVFGQCKKTVADMKHRRPIAVY
jgi:hypothetical protein